MAGTRPICTLRAYNVAPLNMNRIRGNVRWMLIVWMLVISALSYVDRVNIFQN
jgi:hypothetical protein